MADIYNDDFAGSAGLLSAHTPNVGGPYSGWTGAGNDLGRLSLDGSGNLGLGFNESAAGVAVSGPAMPSATGYFECGFIFDSAGNPATVGVGFIQDPTNSSSATLRHFVQRVVTGQYYMIDAGTLFYNSYTAPFTSGVQHVLRLELRAGVVYFYLDGVLKHSKASAVDLTGWKPTIQLDNNQGVLTSVKLTYAKAGTFIPPVFWTSFLQTTEVDA